MNNNFSQLRLGDPKWSPFFAPQKLSFRPGNTSLVSGHSSLYDLRMSIPVSGSGGPALFPHTRWSLVLAATHGASVESSAALEMLCRVYWRPLYAYVRRCGHSPHDAQDLTQEFFARLLAKRWLETVDREKAGCAAS